MIKNHKIILQQLSKIILTPHLFNSLELRSFNVSCPDLDHISSKSIHNDRTVVVQYKIPRVTKTYAYNIHQSFNRNNLQ